MNEQQRKAAESHGSINLLPKTNLNVTKQITKETKRKNNNGNNLAFCFNPRDLGL